MRHCKRQVLQLLAEHLAQWSCSVAFPELGHLASVQLRSLAKALPAERFRTQVLLFDRSAGDGLHQIDGSNAPAVTLHEAIADLLTLLRL